MSEVWYMKQYLMEITYLPLDFNDIQWVLCEASVNYVIAVATYFLRMGLWSW